MCAGYVGDYQVQITQQSRGVDDENAEAIMAACTQEVPDEFNYGLTHRKVIYRPIRVVIPPTPAVDGKNYNGEPITINGKSVILKNEPKTFNLTSAQLWWQPGFDPYEPHQGEYGYGEIPEVITLPQLIRHLALIEGEKT